MKLISLFLLILSFISSCKGSISLLGLGGGGGGMIKGSSFSLDTKDSRKTRVIGNSLQVDLDILEIITGGGILRYSPTHIEFVSYTSFFLLFLLLLPLLIIIMILVISKKVYLVGY